MVTSKFSSLIQCFYYCTFWCFPLFNLTCSISLLVKDRRLSSDFPQECSFDIKVGTCCFSNQVLFNITAAGCRNIRSTSFILSMFVSAKNLLSRLPGVKFETLFSAVTNNLMGQLMSTNNKLIMFSLSVLTLLLVIFIPFYHDKPRFHVNDLLYCTIEFKERVLTTESHSIVNMRDGQNKNLDEDLSYH